IAAKHRLLLAKGSIARADVVVKDRTRSNKRFVLEAYVRGVELRIFAERSVVRRLGKVDPMRRVQEAWSAFPQIHHPEAGEAALAFEQHEIISKCSDLREHDLWAIGNHFAPGFAARIIAGSRDKAESASPGICPNKERLSILAGERTGVMVGVVFVIIFAW